MTISVIIVICLLLLLAYVFDVSSRSTKIPSVILLLLLGAAVRYGTQVLKINVPELSMLLPALGTIGLILIVLEGALDLELNKSKVPLIKKTVLMALLPMLVLATVITAALQYHTGAPLKTALVNAIPFCVISSAIAIPSVRNLPAFSKEFIVYESSLSDIFGVVFFNFIAINEVIDAASFGHFAGELTIITVVSFVSVLGLSFLLSRLNGHITYTPIILLVILIYALSKVYHLPGLVFILVLGIFLGNLEELKDNKWIEKFRPEKLEKEIVKFKEITAEATFLVRALFFLLFGYLMQPSEIVDPYTLPWAAFIVGAVMVIRAVALKLVGLPVLQLLFVAPRGLISILLFIAIPASQSLPLVSNSLLIQTVLLSVLVMMFGVMANGKTRANYKPD